jgi:hypothetical protein
MQVPHQRKLSAGCDAHVGHVLAHLAANEIDSFHCLQPHGEVEFHGNSKWLFVYERAPRGARKNDRHVVREPRSSEYVMNI